jgi:hypothetical protein
LASPFPGLARFSFSLWRSQRRGSSAAVPLPAELALQRASCMLLPIERFNESLRWIRFHLYLFRLLRNANVKRISSSLFFFLS